MVFLVCGSFRSLSFLVFFVVYIFYFLSSSILLITSSVIRNFHSFCQLSQANHSYYLSHMSFTSTALPHSQIHVRLHQMFPLEHFALSVFQHIASPDQILVLLSGNLWLSSSNCGCSKPISCGQSWYLLEANSAHPSNCFWIDATLVYKPTGVVQKILYVSQ